MTLRKVKALRQTTSTVNYRTEFENYAQYLTIGEEALKEYFYEGLKDSVKDAMADLPAELEPDDFDEYKAWCVRIDTRQHERRAHDKPSFRAHGPVKAHAATARPAAHFRVNTPPVRAHVAIPMDLDATSSSSNRYKPLDAKERKRRFDNNLCMYCGNAEHRANACPAKSIKPVARLRATLTGPTNDVDNKKQGKAQF